MSFPPAGDWLRLVRSAAGNCACHAPGRRDAGLQWEVMESEGRGPDMAERIGAFTKKG